MKVFLVPNPNKQEALCLLESAVDILRASGATVLLEPDFAPFIQGVGITFLDTEPACFASDIVVTIGGDGTMLHTARYTMKSQTPLLGINMGQLGFLTTIESDELEKLRRLVTGEFIVEMRSVLQAECSGLHEKELALNDVVLFKQAPEKTVALDIYCDETKVSGFRGDGVVFATATGSTAYSMSAGGPVLDARLGGIVVTSICAHMVNTPPMVFAADRIMRVVPTGRAEETVFLSCDGLKSVPLPQHQEIVIRQADVRVPMIQFADAGQLKSIDKKLKGR